MSMLLKAGLWALGVIAVALLGAVGLLPDRIAETLVVTLPALAVAVLVLPGIDGRATCPHFAARARKR